MDFRKVHSQKYTLINTKTLYFNTKRIIFGPSYKVNFAEDNFAININSKFRDSDKLINIFCEIRNFRYPNSWKYFPQKYLFLIWSLKVTNVVELNC